MAVSLMDYTAVQAANDPAVLARLLKAYQDDAQKTRDLVLDLRTSVAVALEALASAAEHRDPNVYLFSESTRLRLLAVADALAAA